MPPPTTTNGASPAPLARHTATGVAIRVALIGAAWGVMYAVYPIGLARGGPAWLAAARFLVFFLGALVVALVKKVDLLPRTRGDRWAILGYAAFNIVLHNLFLMGGAKHIPIAVVGLLTALNPMVTLLFARMALPGTRMRATTLAGLGLGLAGIAVLDLRGGIAGSSLPVAWVLFTFVGVVAWAAGSVVMKAAAPKMHPLALSMWAALVGYLVLQPLAFATESVPAFDLAYLAAVLFAGLIGGLAAFLLWSAIVRVDGPQRANLATYVSPVAASLAAWAIDGQPVGWAHLVAYVLVAAGLALALRAPATVPDAPVAAE